MSIRLVLLFLPLLRVFPLDAQNSTQSSPSNNQSKNQHGVVPQDYEQFIPYWITEGNWHSELQLRNNLRTAELTVTPSLRAADGSEFALPAVTIKPEEVQSVDINNALPLLTPQFTATYGSVVLRYHAQGLLNLYAAVMAHDMGHPLAFHIDGINEVENYDQVSREGIWWLPRDSVKDQLILTNYGKYLLKLTLSLYDQNGKVAKQQIALGPRETGRYSVRELLKQMGLVGTYGGIKVESAAHAGSLDTVHVLLDEENGFSANLKMFDRDPRSEIKDRDFAQAGSWILRAPMLALPNPDPSLGFPRGTTLQPLLFVHNTTDHQVTSTLQLNWRADSTTGKVMGPALSLQPYETRRIDVSALVPKEAHWSAVILKTNGQPDEVMAVAASYDAGLRYGSQTPFSDQMTFRWEGGYWEYDANHDSIITAGNGGLKPIKAAFAVYYARGSEKYEIEQILQPDEQMWIDIGDLIRRQVPDKTGKTLPSDLSSGSYQFVDLTNKAVGSLFEGKVIYDKTFGHVSYGCASCCAYIGSPWFSPNPLRVLLQGTNQADVQANDGCDGYTSSVLDGFVSWSSANTTVATVDPPSALVRGMGAGSAIQSSPGTMTIGALDFKKCRIGQYTPGGPATIQIPDHLSVVSDSTNPYTCPIGASRQRNVNYNVLDINQNIIVRPISVLETVDPSTLSNCNGASVHTSYSCTPIATGNFTDGLSPGCPSTAQLAQGCGYTFPDQVWEWCNPVSTPVSIGNIGQDVVDNNIISLGGNSVGFSPGTTFPH
ncbi:MAG TPA: hypothetical protein VIX42_08865 [Edaphobacter sp.]